MCQRCQCWLLALVRCAYEAAVLVIWGFPCATVAGSARFPKDGLARTPEMYLHVYVTCFELQNTDSTFCICKYTFFFAGVDPSNTKIVLKLRTLLIGAIGHCGHRVTATDSATTGEWIIFSLTSHVRVSTVEHWPILEINLGRTSSVVWYNTVLWSRLWATLDTKWALRGP